MLDGKTDGNRGLSRIILTLLGKDEIKAGIQLVDQLKDGNFLFFVIRVKARDRHNGEQVVASGIQRNALVFQHHFGSLNAVLQAFLAQFPCRIAGGAVGKEFAHAVAVGIEYAVIFLRFPGGIALCLGVGNAFDVADFCVVRWIFQHPIIAEIIAEKLQALVSCHNLPRSVHILKELEQQVVVLLQSIMRLVFEGGKHVAKRRDHALV